MKKIEHYDHKDWGKCVLYSNEKVDLYIPTQFGPRVIYFALKGNENIFSEFPTNKSRIGSDQWTPYGGHRLWIAPEHTTRTYQPDNKPVDIKTNDHGLEIIQEVEPATGIQKIIQTRLVGNKPSVSVIHTLINHNSFPIEISPWAVSIMSQKGTAIVPFPKKIDHEEKLTAEFTLSIWAYTDLSDPRFIFGTNYLQLQHRQDIFSPQKIGFGKCAKWAAYINKNQLFIKSFFMIPNMIYPDLGSSLELYTDQEKLEIETLGPIQEIQPNESLQFAEKWYIFEYDEDLWKEDKKINNFVQRIASLIN